MKIGPDFSHAPAAIAYIDAAEFGNFVRFANHSCENNAGVSEDRVGLGRVLGVRCVREVWPGDEVCLDYGADFFRERVCLCGSGKYRYGGEK